MRPETVRMTGYILCTLESMVWLSPAGRVARNVFMFPR